MIQIIDRVILWLAGVLLAVRTEQVNIVVPIVLLALTVSAASIYFGKTKITSVIWILYLLVCLYQPVGMCFLPLLIYDSIKREQYYGMAALIISYSVKDVFHVEQICFFILLTILSVVMAYKTKRLEMLKIDLIHLRDTSAELNYVMTQRNRELLQKQDDEIHMATLKERNRIAREIHDNVGHMLSCSILQMGALMAIHKEEPLHEQLLSVNDTLNLAMNNIRESVHDLHDESVDLKQAVLEATKEVRENYQFHMEYDISEQIPRNIKYCFIVIIKEAVSNIIKHSNADSVEIIFREHPALYQLSITDNGTNIKTHTDTGMGLANMRERVEALGGTIHIQTEKGFRIFISIQKTEEKA